MEAGRLAPDGGRLALAGRAAPLRRVALEVGPAERPRSMFTGGRGDRLCVAILVASYRAGARAVRGDDNSPTASAGRRPRGASPCTAHVSAGRSGPTPPSASSRSASRSFRTICSGVCLLPFTRVTSFTQQGDRDSHNGWTRFRGHLSGNRVCLVTRTVLIVGSGPAAAGAALAASCPIGLGSHGA
jgi:hypothetical protein